MARLDNSGLTIATTSGRAAEPYLHGVDLFLSAWLGAGEAHDEAYAADADFALAHAARSRLHDIRAERDQAIAFVAKATAKATALVARRGTERERKAGTLLDRCHHRRPSPRDARWRNRLTAGEG